MGRILTVLVVLAVILLLPFAAAQSEQGGPFNGFLDDIFDGFDPFDGPGPGEGPIDNGSGNDTNDTNASDNDTVISPPGTPPGDRNQTPRNDMPPRERIGDGPAEQAPLDFTTIDVDRQDERTLNVEPAGNDEFRVELHWGRKTSGSWNLNITRVMYVRQGDDEEINVYSDWVQPVPCQREREQQISYPRDAVLVNVSDVEDTVNGSITEDDFRILGRDGPSDYVLCERDRTGPAPGNGTQPGNNTTANISDRLTSLMDDYGTDREFAIWIQLADGADNETVARQVREIGVEEVEAFQDVLGWASPEEIRTVAQLDGVSRIDAQEFECEQQYPHSRFCHGSPVRYADANQTGPQVSSDLLDLITDTEVGEPTGQYEYRAQLSVQDGVDMERVVPFVEETGVSDITVQEDNATIVVWGTLNELGEVAKIDYLTRMDVYRQDTSPVRPVEEEEQSTASSRTNRTNSPSTDTENSTSQTA